MKITIKALKRVINEALLKEITLRTRDGVEWVGDRDKIVQALVKFGSPSAEREAILSGQVPISSAAASSLKSQGAVKRPVKPYVPSKASSRSYDPVRASLTAEKKLVAMMKA